MSNARDVEHVLHFLASVAHEFKSALSSIAGLTRMLSDGHAGEVNSRQLEILALVNSGTKQVATLADDLVDLSLFARGELRLNYEPIDLAAEMQALLRQFEPLLDQADLRLVNRVGPSLGIVEADPKRIRQVLSNLFSNAIKFSLPHGTILVSGYRGRDWVRLTVTDTGLGIPCEEQSRVFDLFYRGTNASEGKRDGSGLGLATARRLVEAHGGSIWVRSEPNRGSRFGFRLPLGPSPEGALLGASSRRGRERRNRPGVRLHLTRSRAARHRRSGDREVGGRQASPPVD